MHSDTSPAVVFELFGPLAISAGKTHVTVNLSSNTTVQSAVHALIQAHPEIHADLQAAVIAADGVRVERNAVLVGGEQLTVITLVSGG